MALKDDLETEVAAIFRDQWERRDGTAVPSDTSLKLGNDGIDLDATVLYADLSESTDLVAGWKDWFAAEVYKAFLRCAAKIIRSEGGEIVAYDGDRVMAIYLGDSKNTSAVRTALKINWACKQLIQPAIQRQWPNNTYTLKHTVGIDTSKLLVARAGIRGANDLVWIGRAANHAAKLCAESDAYPTWISDDIYDNMHTSVRDAKDGTNMWSQWTWTKMNNRIVYSSTYWWPF
jgi:class 3 adenylate cyclase